MVSTIKRIGILSLFCLAAAGCVSKQAMVTDKEDLLSAAGFDARPANTPERQAMLAKLPPHHFVQKAEGDKLVYLYSDPLVCDCLYIGSQQNYGRYKQEMFQRQLANQAQLTADTYQDSAWNWGPWGPGLWWYR